MPAGQKSTLSRPLVAAGANMNAPFARTSAWAAVRFAASVVAPVMVGSVPYAATKLASDSMCFRFCPNSNQFA